jgi:hypothetical protein
MWKMPTIIGSFSEGTRLMRGVGRFFVSTGIMLLVPAFAIADPTKYASGSVCPEFIEAEARFTFSPIQGWTAVESNSPLYPGRRHRLEQVEFYDGPVERLRSLMPNGGDKGRGNIWQLGSYTKKRGAWIECIYAAGFIRLAKQLPATTNECRVRRAPSPTINGHDFITAIKCK